MGGQRVLAIEQDWRIRKLIRANLEALGLRVQEAVSEQHGLQLLHESQPDLILLDLDRREEGALRLLHDLDLCLAGRPVPVILMSAEPLGRHLMQSRQQVSCLLKPFSVPDLLVQVERALGVAPTGDQTPNQACQTQDTRLQGLETDP